MTSSSAHKLAVLTVALALGALLTACARTAPPMDLSTASPEEVLARSREVMASQEGFQGGNAYAPTQLAPTFTYAAPDRLLLRDLGGDFYPYMLLIGDEVFFSHDGQHWLTSPEMVPVLAFFRLYFDPRALLAYAREPEDRGVETVGGDPYRVLVTRLDVDAFLKDLPPSKPRLHLNVRFPYAQETSAQALEAQGYDVVVIRSHGSVVWELIKGPFYFSIYEDLGGPARHEPESGSVSLRATVEGFDALEPEVEDELKAVLRAFGAEPGTLDQANIRVQDEDPRGPLREMLQDVALRFWIDEKTARVKRSALEGQPQLSDEAVLGFWGFDESVSLERPVVVMDARRANALERVVQQGFATLRDAVEAYRDRHGRYPEELTPETLSGVLDDLGLTWPTNAFRDAPMQNSPESSGDFHYFRQGGSYELSIYGWDHVMTRKLAEPSPPSALMPTLPEEAIAQGLDRARALDFPVLWLGKELRLTPQEGAPLPPLVLAKAEVCPRERACVWPVLFGYTIDAPGYPIGGPMVSVYARPRQEAETVAGEPMQIAAGEATVRIGQRPLPYDSEFSAWEAMVWLPESVVRVHVSPLGRDPDRNPFSDEAALTMVVHALEELR